MLRIVRALRSTGQKIGHNNKAARKIETHPPDTAAPCPYGYPIKLSRFNKGGRMSRQAHRGEQICAGKDAIPIQRESSSLSGAGADDRSGSLPASRSGLVSSGFSGLVVFLAVEPRGRPALASPVSF